MIDWDLIISCWKNDKLRRNLWLPVIFACGIGLYFLLPQEPNKWITMWAIEILIVLAVILRRRLRLLYALGCIFLFVLGFAIIQLKSIYLDSNSPAVPFNESFYLKGIITAIDHNYKGKTRFTFDSLEDFEGNQYSGKYRITPRSNNVDAKIGQCVEMVGTIMPPAPEANVGGFQNDRKNYFEGIKGSGYAESNYFSSDCANVSVSQFKLHLATLRQNIAQHIYQILPPAQASIASAIIAGEKSLVDFAQYEQYRNSGLAHFLAISGLHMSMLCGFMFFVIRFILALIPWILLRVDSRKIAAVVSLITGFVYLLISGMAVPAQRAFIMIAVVLLGVLANRRAISMYTVGLAALLVLLISPEVLISASFQMSFAAVIGLVAFYERYATAIHNYFIGGNRWWRGLKIYFCGIIITDFIASMSTLPFAIYHFNMVAIYTTLGNLAAGPVIGFVIMPCVLFALLLMPLGGDVIFLKAAGWGIAALNYITSWVSSLPHAGLYVPSMPVLGLLCIVFGGLWLAIWQCRWRVWGAYAIGLGFLSILFVRTPDVLVSNDLKAIAFKNDNGKLELVSTRGGSFIKQAWRSRYPFASQIAMAQAHPEFYVDGDIVTLGSQQVNLKDVIGFSAYKKGDDYTIRTIRDDIGNRPWNRKN